MTERSQQEILSLLAKGLPDLSYSTIKYSYAYIYDYLALALHLKLQPSTLGLVDSAPSSLTILYGRLADLYISKHNITYQSLAAVMQFLVRLGELNFNLDDSMSHFVKSTQLFDDVKSYLEKNYIKALEKKINGNPRNTNKEVS